MKRRRVAIVTPWFGEDCRGGAELQASELAMRLSHTADVTVLTTTSRSFLHDWDIEYHKTGETRVHGYRVRRFGLQPRDRELFHRLNEELLALGPERWAEICAKRTKYSPYIDESINSPDLEAHLQRRACALYDAVIFLPYLYGVVVRGIERYPGPAHLIPCLHDEAYARIPRIEDAIHRAATLLFNSAGESELALRLYGPGILTKSRVIGEGIPPAANAAEELPVERPYYIYLGRREPEKGVDSLVEVFRGRNGQQGPALILAGPGERSYDDPAFGIRDLGFVDEGVKVALLRNAIALLNPSRNESYSRVLMEAWREGLPVVANASCLATATAVRETGAGFVAETAPEWVDALRRLEMMTEQERRELGARGAEYARRHTDWGQAIDRLRVAIGIGETTPKHTGKRIDQVLEGFDDGDAISDCARNIAARLRQRGYESTIFANNLPSGVDGARHLEPRSLAGADAVIYHHSIGSAAVGAVTAARCRKAMVYHNITPARFFVPYAPAVARQLEQGRDQLASLVPDFDLLVAASDYNASELRALGASAVRTIPVVANLQRLDRSPEPRALNANRGTTWLFVGRLIPNKGIAQLIDAFEAYLSINSDANLVILGKYDRADRYYNELRTVLRERKIDPYVTFTGYVDEAGVVGRYRSADVFVCLSEHEGFCVPLVEAMFFDVPIVARSVTAIPETLGSAGLLLEPNSDAYDVAAAVHEICTDSELRTRVIAAQRERRRAFFPERIDSLIDRLATDLIAETA